MANMQNKDVIVIDYNLPIADASVENVRKLITSYLQVNSYSHSDYSGVPFLLNLHFLLNDPKVANTSRMFVAGSSDDNTPQYRGYEEDGTIEPIDVCVTFPIFPVCFSKDVFQPLYRLVQSNYNQFEKNKYILQATLNKYSIEDNSILLMLDRVRDAVLEFCIDRYQSSYDKVADLFRQVDGWFSKNLPQEKDDWMKFLTDCLNSSMDTLIDAVKFVAYGTKQNIEEYSDMIELKDENIIENDISVMADILTDYTRRELAHYHHMLREMSYTDDVMADDKFKSEFYRNLPIKDLETSARHNDLAGYIEESDFFEEQGKNGSSVYGYLMIGPVPKSVNMSEQAFHCRLYSDEKFTKLLTKIIKLYGSGGDPQKRYCDQLYGNLNVPKETKQEKPKTPETPKRQSIRQALQNLLNKLGLGSKNNSSINSDGNQKG